MLISHAPYYGTVVVIAMAVGAPLHLPTLPGAIHLSLPTSRALPKVKVIVCEGREHVADRTWGSYIRLFVTVCRDRPEKEG